jgi:hypothetical protein
MNYTDIVTSLSTNLPVDPSDTAFLAVLPSAFAYAEGRITRELDLMAANVRDSSASTAALNRNFTCPTTVGTFLVIDGVNVITPASTAPDSGTRTPLIPVSRDFLDLVYPSTTGATVPQYFAYLSQDTYSSPAQTQIIFGPWPDATYRIEVIGKIQPAGLSSTNTTTWLSVNLPDLFISCVMVYLVGALQHNYGAQADEPRSAQSWESQYTLLRESASTWQARARFGAASWSSKQIEPQAQPQRG